MKERYKRFKKKKVTKSQVLSIRLDPQLKYLAELISRKERRSLSNYIEWAVEKSVEMSNITVQEMAGQPTLWEAKCLIWDIDEADRFVKLKKYFPDLLTYDDAIIWKIIKERPYFWKQPIDLEKIDIEESLAMVNLREQWEGIKMVVNGEMAENELEELSLIEYPLKKKSVAVKPDEKNTPF